MKISKLEKLVIVSLLMCNMGGGIHSAWAAAVPVQPGDADKLGTHCDNYLIVRPDTAIAINSSVANPATWELASGDTWSYIAGGGNNGFKDKADRNTVILMAEGKTYGEICGANGNGDGGSENYNDVFISYGKASDHVYGGKSHSEANYNSVTISGQAEVPNTAIIYGGLAFALTGVANNNTVQISTTTGNTTVKYLGGGYADGGNTGNTLIISDKNVTATTVERFDTYAFYMPKSVGDGMLVADNVNFTGKTFVISPDYSYEWGSVINLVKGTDYSSFPDTKVTIDNAPGNTYSGSTEASGTVEYDTLGGTGLVYVAALRTAWKSVQPGTLTNNVVEVTTNKKATVNTNLQEASSAKWQDVYGGYANMVSATVADNQVTIKSGVEITGSAYGGYSHQGNVLYNNVIIESGTNIKGNVYGGRTTFGDAIGNCVTVEDGAVFGQDANVYGGYSKEGSAINNKVILKTGGRFGDTNFYGGYGDKITAGTKTSSGNFLWVEGPSVTIMKAANFQEYVFDLTKAAKGDVMLTINDSSNFDMAGSTINVYTEGGSLQAGDAVTLIAMSDAAAKITNIAKTVKMTDGIVDTEGQIYGENGDETSGWKNLMFKMKSGGGNTPGANSKAPVEGLAASSALVNTSTDLAVGAGMANLITTTGAGSGAEPFAAANFGSSRYETGSHVDSKGYGLMVGVGKKVFNKAGDKTTGGLFFEYGNGSFDTYNDNNVNGDGKNIYKGGGFMMRWDNKKSGNYYEGMIHAGKTNTTWNCSQMGGYNVSPTYYGGALTYGHKFMFKDNNQVSVYGMYIYSRTGGASAEIKGHTYDFEATKSHRTRLGVRYAKSDLMDTLKYRPYVGLAWEREYNGETNATIVGVAGSPASPSMKGNTGILEFGCNTEAGKWTLGVGANLYTGKRKGWSGTLQAVYNF